MVDFFTNIGDAISSIGDFFSSAVRAIQYIVSFIYQCIDECSDLLSIIPGFVSTLIISAVVFSVILAGKRAIFG